MKLLKNLTPRPLLFHKRLLPIIVLVTLLLLCNNPRRVSSAREFPICIDAENIDARTYAFRPIFRYHNNADEFVPVSQDKKGMKSPRGYIQEIKLTRITVVEPTIPDDHALKVLRQWVHITVKAGKKIKLSGLYMQVIAGPLGLPKGQFQIDFDCMDCANKTSSLGNAAIVPCKYRSESSYRHPNALVVGGDSRKPVKFTEFHFNFNWVESYTDGLPYFQFLVIAVRNFKRRIFESYYTNPLDNTNMDGNAAVLSPFYRGWAAEDLKCHIEYDPLGDPDKALPFDHNTDDETKIRTNEEWDDCMINDTPLENTLLCPPGLLIPDKPDQSPNDWISDRKKDFKSNPKTKPCRHCGESHIPFDICASTPTTPGCNTPEAPEVFDEGALRSDATNQEWEDFSAEEKGVKWMKRGVYRYHAIAMIFCFSICSSISIFYARFMKESTPILRGDCCLGIGTWLVAHVNLTYLSLAALWAGIMLIYGSNISFVCDTLKKKKTEMNETVSGCKAGSYSHVGVGVFPVLGFIVAYGSGWWRPPVPSARNMVILTHVIGGLFSKYAALLSIIPPMTHIQPVVASLWVVAEVICIAVFVAASVVQSRMDAELGIQPMRSLFPVLEAIDTFKNPPLAMIRTILLSVHASIQLLLFILIIALY